LISEGEKKKKQYEYLTVTSLPGGCDGRTRSATVYHVPDGILIFSGSEGENGEEEGL